MLRVSASVKNAEIVLEPCCRFFILVTLLRCLFRSPYTLRTASFACSHVVRFASCLSHHYPASSIIAMPAASKMSSLDRSFSNRQYFLNSMIHASTSFFPSNLGTSEVFILSEGSLAGWAYGAWLFAKGACIGGVAADVAAGATGACIGGVAAEVAAGATGACIGGGAAEAAAELASSWSRASRFVSLCSIL